MLNKILCELKKYAEPDFAEWFRPFLNLNSNSDEILLGVRVPVLRKIAKKYSDIDNDMLQQMLASKYHEIKELAIFIMLIKTKKEPEEMCNMYLNNLNYINNWDLIDYSAPHIVAPNADTDVLRELSDSGYLWANRVAMVSTIYFIKQNDFNLTLEFAEKYINHPHHLIHKATGWMLREIGKRDINVLISFLNKYYAQMPAIMRNYATERIKNTNFSR